jgi:HK97 gp10 family phage protein
VTTRTVVRIVPNHRGLADFRRRLARGMTAVMLDAETEAKRETPVHGGYRSFVPGAKPIGGTLRRSVHSAVFLDGSLVGGHSEDGKAPLGDMVGIPGRIVGYVGTNSGYGSYVDLGTSKMPARPFLEPGLELAARRAPETMRRAMGGG